MKLPSPYLASLAAGVLLATGPALNAAVITEYTFNTNTLVATNVASGMTATDLSSPAINNLSVGNTSVTVSNTLYESTAADALAEGRYLKFTLEATGANLLDLDNITFGGRRTNSSPRRT